jgi:uncharacterized protein YukE
MLLQEAVLQEIRSGVDILQNQDNQIVQEANSVFEAHRKELEAISKRVTDCDGQILSIKGVNVGIQQTLKNMNDKIAKVNEILGSIKNSLKEIPSKKELREHVAVMEDQLAQSRELNTGLTTAMEGYKFSESVLFAFGKEGPQAGPSTTVHPERQHYFGSNASSLRDTESEVTWLERIRGGAGSDGAAGGAAGGEGDPPPPGSGPPLDHGDNNNNPRISR